MEDYIVTMRDGIMTLNRIIPEKSVSFNTLVRTAMTLEKQDYTCTPVLPGSDGSCRVYAENSKAVGFLIQCNPTVKTIRFIQKGRTPQVDYRRDPEHKGDYPAYLFDVSMPWIWVFCKLLKVEEHLYQWRRCFLCATYDNIETLDDRIYVAPVPNQWGDSCLMCTGSIIKETDQSEKPALICRKFVYKLWNSYFNNDLNPAMPSMIAKEGASLLDMLGEWEKKTKENPGIGLSHDFGLKDTRHGGSLGQFIGNVMGGAYDDAR